MKTTRNDVDCPIGPAPIKQPNGTYIGKTFKELHDSCARDFYVQPKIEMNVDIGDTSASSTTCDHLATCRNAVKFEVPLKLSVDFNYNSMVILGNWKQAQDPNVSAAATGAYGQLKSEVENHEKGHVNVTKTFVNGIDKSKYKYVLEITACTDGDDAAMQEITDSLSDLVGLVPQTEINEAISAAHLAAQDQYEKSEQTRLNAIRQTWYPILLHKTP